jgi:ribosomal protein S18 acetylase RimI-like enzyme
VAIVCIHDRDEIERFARRDPARHLYELGDLDDFHWPHTSWYGLRDGEGLSQLVLLYADLQVPVLLANAEPPVESMAELLGALAPMLPRRFYAHLDPRTIDSLAPWYAVEAYGMHDKMALRDRAAIARVDFSAVLTLHPVELDLAAVQALYRVAAPATWFVPRMLESGVYCGVRVDGDLVSVAGVHAYSHAQRVAVLGNVATHPAWRGRGFATAACAHICARALAEGIEHIGLNVKADNAAAIACYRRLGFEPIAMYGEYMLTAQAPPSR